MNSDKYRYPHTLFEYRLIKYSVIGLRFFCEFLYTDDGGLNYQLLITG